MNAVAYGYEQPAPLAVIPRNQPTPCTFLPDGAVFVDETHPTPCSAAQAILAMIQPPLIQVGALAEGQRADVVTRFMHATLSAPVQYARDPMTGDYVRQPERRGILAYYAGAAY